MRIRLPRKRFYLMRHNHWTGTVFPMRSYWFRRSARRAAEREQRDEDMRGVRYTVTAFTS